MADSSVLDTWYDKTTFVYFTDGSVAEGKIINADQVGLEFELVRFLRGPGEELERKAPMDDVKMCFLPWGQVRALYRPQL